MNGFEYVSKLEKEQRFVSKDDESFAKVIYTVEFETFVNTQIGSSRIETAIKNAARALQREIINIRVQGDRL